MSSSDSSIAGPDDPSLLRRIVVGRRPLATLVRILLLVLVVVIAMKWMVNRLAYRSREPGRGDIVSIGELTSRRDMYMKRIVALPGETFLIRDGYVHVNGERLVEPYVVHRAPWNHLPITLADDEYMVIGDNRGMHITEHKFGRVERRYIVGKLWF